jgi:hypothetical protein
MRLPEMPKENAFSAFDIITSIVFSLEMKRHDLEIGACELGG